MGPRIRTLAAGIFAWLTALTAYGEDQKCLETDAGLSLPKGFCASIFADNIGHARQLAVTPEGVVYVNTWRSGIYYGNDKPHDGGFLVALKDTKGTGHADVNLRFGPTFAEGSHGGTGIWLYKNWLYAELNDKIVRYELKKDEVAPTGKPETILSGMPITGDHPMHGFSIDQNGNLFVEMGSATNACEKQNRMPHSAGNDPCTELETRAGIWRYDANKTDQVFSPNERYATGIRNGEGFDFDTSGRLYVTQHGREQLHQDWPELYTAQQGWEVPGEEVVVLKEGANYGWPFCYYDGTQRKLVLAPEYGGDGGKKIGDCDKFKPPVAAFPAHWAPNDLKIYKASLFPKAYQGGAFIAFHGSWNVALGAQAGYNIVFQPLSDGNASGDYVVFADDFAGQPGEARHRPSGLAVGADGALYISDDKAGRIWRVTYSGDPNAPLEAAPRLSAEAGTSSSALSPEGEHPDAGTTGLPVPAGATAEQVALGGRIFHGEVAGGTCAGCHGVNGTGTPVGANLTSGTWIWGDGSLQSITDTIKNGVPQPKQHPGVMPPLGGVDLSDSDLAAIAAYVWAIGHQKNG